MTPRELTELRRITGTMLTASQARLAALRAREQAVLDRITELDAALRERAATATPEDPALRAGADLRWRIWVEQSRSNLLSAQARLRAAIVEETVHLRRDFGRDHVLGELERQARRDAQRLAQRRAARDG